MVTNAVITIFNRFPDRESKKMVYVPHVLEKVWFHADRKSAVGEKGLFSTDVYQIRIPYPCEGWLPVQDYRELAEPGEKWTVENGDLFLKGRWDGGTVSGIREIKEKFSGVVGTVLNHSENFFGSSKHIRIGGGS